MTSAAHGALQALLDRYISLVNSGDAGNWNPEEEVEVIAARAALAAAPTSALKGRAAIVEAWNNLDHVIRLLPGLDALYRACLACDDAPAEPAVAVQAEPVAEFYCNKCGYVGPTQYPHKKPNHYSQCNYMASPIAHPKPAAPVAVQSVYLSRDTQGVCVVEVNGREVIRDSGDIISHFATPDSFEPSALEVQAVEELAQLGYTVRDGLLYPPCAEPAVPATAELPKPAFVIEVNDEPDIPVFTAEQMREFRAPATEEDAVSDDEIDPTIDVYSDVKRERMHQDLQWGGPDHDDEHDVDDWLVFIQRQVRRGHSDVRSATDFWTPKEKRPIPRARFVKIAALAVAAIESIDRKEGKAPAAHPKPAAPATADEAVSELVADRILHIKRCAGNGHDPRTRVFYEDACDIEAALRSGESA